MNDPQRLSGWNRTIAAFASIVFIALVIGFALYRQTPPPAQPVSGPSAEFSSGRAMQHLRIIAQKPHSIGTPAAEEVRQYIFKELNEMGASPVIQTANVVTQKDSKFASGATVNNIVARLKGEGGSKAVLLMSHYDSAPTSPGASDDGSAVVTMLETLRALKSSPALKNDVIFLFTDGEEIGLLGAKAFVDQNPWAKDVGLALNFEARGVSGPAIMFETSAGNEWLIQEFAKAAPHPVANSLTYEIYKRLPNDTDLTVLKKAGYAGLNFAFINGVNRYHSRLDNVDHLDERSLQHQGSYALALTRHFGNLNLEHGPGNNNAIYFSVLSLFLVHYSTRLGILLAALATLAFIGLIVLGLKKKTLTVGRLLWGLLAVSLSVIASFVLVTVLVIVTFSKWQNGNNGFVLFVSLMALTLGITSTMLILFRNRASMQGLLIGGLSWWQLLMIVTTLLLPGGTYLFTWPLLFGIIGAGFILMTKDPALLSPKAFALYSLCAIPGLLLMPPLLYLLYTGIGLGVAGALMLLVVLLTALLIPHLYLITSQKKWLLPLGSSAVCLVLLVIGIFSASFNEDYPKTNSLFYVMNSKEKAIWASSDVKPDEWTAQFLSAQAEKGSLSEYIPSNNLPILKAQAPLVSLAAPEIVLLDERTENQMRTLRLRVTTPRRAPLVSIHVDSKEGILDAAVNGQRVAGDDPRTPAKYDNPWVLNYWAVPVEGIELTVSVKPSQALNINVVDSSYDLPQVPGQSLAGRPGHLMPMQFGYTDSTLVSKSMTF